MGENLPDLVAWDDANVRSERFNDIQDNRARQPNGPWRRAAVVDGEAKAFIL
jgi:hypothetical protein